MTQASQTKKVLISFVNREFDPCGLGKAHEMLRAHGFEITQFADEEKTCMSAKEADELLPEYDAIISMGLPVDRAFLEKMTPRLKIVARYGIGFDEIEVKLAREYGVAVTTTREFEHTNAVAEMAYALMLSMLCHVPQYYGDYVVKKNFKQIVRNEQVYGKTIGFFAFGGIAQRFAELLGTSGARLIAYDIFPNRDAAARLSVEWVSFDELLGGSDIISIHAPGTPENRHIFNAEAFSKMKAGAYLVNTARGILVDEAALYGALQSGKLKGAATDVMDPEPALPDNPLFTLDNFIATPHIAGHSIQGRNKLCVSAAQAVIDLFEGRTPHFLVN